MGGGKTERRGGTLSRSETVTVRLDPKLNYLCELAARSQRRTKSSLIEAAVAAALNHVPLDPRLNIQPNPNIAQMAENLWDIDEVARFQRLAHFAPHLMTYEEQAIWSTICKSPYFWWGIWKDFDHLTFFYSHEPTAQSMWLERVRDNWDLIKSVAQGNADERHLPKMEIFRSKQDTSEVLLAGNLNQTPDQAENK